MALPFDFHDNTPAITQSIERVCERYGIIPNPFFVDDIRKSLLSDGLEIVKARSYSND